MLERHAINVSIVEVDDHLTEKPGDDPELWSESLPFDCIDIVGKTQKYLTDLTSGDTTNKFWYEEISFRNLKSDKSQLTRQANEQVRVTATHLNDLCDSYSYLTFKVIFQEPVSIQWWFYCLNPTDRDPKATV